MDDLRLIAFRRRAVDFRSGLFISVQKIERDASRKKALSAAGASLAFLILSLRSSSFTDTPRFGLAFTHTLSSE